MRPYIAAGGEFVLSSNARFFVGEPASNTYKPPNTITPSTPQSTNLISIRAGLLAELVLRSGVGSSKIRAPWAIIQGACTRATTCKRQSASAGREGVRAARPGLLFERHHQADGDSKAPKSVQRMTGGQIRFGYHRPGSRGNPYRDTLPASPAEGVAIRQRIAAG
jgi:hypothetical protein